MGKLMKNFLLKQVTIIIPISVAISPLMMGLNTVHIWSRVKKNVTLSSKNIGTASRRPLQITNQIIAGLC